MNTLRSLLFTSIFAMVLFAMVPSCGDKAGEEEKMRMQHQLDSLRLVNEEKERELAEMSSFMVIVSEGLDSLSMYEDTFLNIQGPERSKLTRSQLRERIDGFAQLLDRQRQRIMLLEDSLRLLDGDGIAKLRSIITYLNGQLDEKNRTVEQLRAELRYRNVDISRLRSKVDTLTSANEQLTSTVKIQTEALTVQDEVINECYVRIGTKKELKEAGILTKGGLFRKSKLDISKLTPSNFNAVDIRNFTSIELPSSKVKIITTMPATSYQLVPNGDVTTLHILNPNEFWSVSNYLVIQID